MNRVAVFVDAGYLFAQGSVLLTGSKQPRSAIRLNEGQAIEFFQEFAGKISGVPLLRVYWYDGTATGPTAQHLALANLANVKVRLGLVNNFGQQKGVDSLIITDMITLARNRAVSDAVLISGDEDLRVGVQQAQEFGARVHLVGIKPCHGSQSLLLMQEADTTTEWCETEVSDFLDCSAAKATPAGAAAVVAPLVSVAGDDPLAAVALALAAEQQPSELQAMVKEFEALHQIPQQVDARLLAGARGRIGQDLDPAQKRQIREIFIRECRQRLG